MLFPLSVPQKYTVEFPRGSKTCNIYNKGHHEQSKGRKENKMKGNISKIYKRQRLKCRNYNELFKLIRKRQTIKKIGNRQTENSQKRNINRKKEK